MFVLIFLDILFSTHKEPVKDVRFEVFMEVLKEQGLFSDSVFSPTHHNLVGSQKIVSDERDILRL